MSIPVISSIAALRESLRSRRDSGPIGFVPTMGALHAGHASLIRNARTQSGCVVVSIFVNPLQFDRPDDYERYARTLPSDIALCESCGADFIFAPSVSEMYPGKMKSAVEVSGLSEHFCGASRPGHFRGVTTVVASLFNIVQPQLAFFGEKDAQQLAVIQRMVDDLKFPIRIVPVATVREADGLALSSRNARLTPDERVAATCLFRALTAANDHILAGERDAFRVLEPGRAILAEPGIRVDYFDLADPASMVPVTTVSGPVRAMGAIWLGSTRLIDNVLCNPAIPLFSN